MKRSALLAAVTIALLLGGAWLLYNKIFDDGAPQAESVTKQNPSTTNSKSAKGPVDNTLTSQLPPSVDPSIGSSVGSDIDSNVDSNVDSTVGDDTKLASLDSSDLNITQRAGGTKVTSVNGRVERRRKGGAWRRVQVGDQLGLDESIRTGRGADANLVVGNGINVRLSPRSEFEVRELTEGLSRVRLNRGHVTARVDEGGRRVLQVETPGSDAVAESRGGEFGVVTDGLGQLVVAAKTGKVKLTSAGQSTTLEPGTSARAQPGQPPSAPTAIPKNLYVKLTETPKAHTNANDALVRGKTDPNTVVRVEGRLAQVGATGNFAVRVPLNEGKNKLRVEVLDPLGRRRDLPLPDIEVDRQKPPIDVDIKWGDRSAGPQATQSLRTRAGPKAEAKVAVPQATQ